MAAIKTITSLNDLIQKIYNDYDFINFKFPALHQEIENDIYFINDSSSYNLLIYYIGHLEGILRTLSIIEYISSKEKKILSAELYILKAERSEYIASRFVQCTEEGD